MFPDEEFLPKVPDPEDFVVEDPENVVSDDAENVAPISENVNDERTNGGDGDQQAENVETVRENP